MRILLTGGAGYIGSHAARLCQAHDHEVWVYDNLSTGHRDCCVGRLIVGHLKDAAALERALVENRIEAVVHFAALTQVGESVRDPELYYENNLAGSLTLMRLMRRHGIHRFVFSSTCATYGVPRSADPITEEEPQRPVTPYGNTKLAVERALCDYAAAYRWGVAILRYFNAAGASPDGSLGEDHDPETHLIPLVIQAALGLRPAIDLYGTDYPTPDGTCIRDYIHVDDLADAHLRALQRLTPGRPLICNLGTGHGHSVWEVIRTVEAVTGRTVPVRQAPRRPGDPPVLVARADRARELLGWEPRYKELRATVETAWNWHRRRAAARPSAS
jgi:UDP-glucose-4-epimerase GalE